MSELLHFLGEYDATVDAKGRFLLPAGITKQLPEAAANQFVINRGFEACLTLYPLQSWQPIFKTISTLNDFDPKVREFRRIFLNGATQVELDSAKRILLPKNLLSHAGIEKEITVVSAVDKIEIWDREKYKQFIDKYTAEDFSILANAVMNKNADDGSNL